MPKYINSPVFGIDIAADYSIVAVLTPNGELYRKPFRISHTLEGLDYLVYEIKKVEKKFNMKAATFMESTGIYHKPLFHYLINKGFDAHTINPIIINSNKNSNIRKVKNDKQDAINIAKICKYQDIKLSSGFDIDLYTLKSLEREYYKLTDTKSTYKKKLSNDLRVMFPGYCNIFSDITSKTSLEILQKYPNPDSILSAEKTEIINLISTCSRKGLKYAENKYSELVEVAKSAKVIGIYNRSLSIKIISNINIIKSFEFQIETLLSEIQNLLSEPSFPKDIVHNIELLQTIPGIGKLTAITIISEIGDIKDFTKSKQLVAFLGLDPSVKESGKFKGSNNHISKRGTRIGRKALHTAALASIRCNRNGKANNPILLEYYQNNMKNKSKKVGLVAIMHKLVNYIFAVLRDQKPYEFRNPKLHSKMFLENKSITKTA